MRKSFLLLLTTLLLLGCGRSTSFDEAVSIDLSQETLAGIKLGENLDDPAFQSRYGSDWKYQPHDEYRYLELSPTLNVATAKGDGKIIRITAAQGRSDHPSTTAQGITIGDTKQKILDQYGDSFYTRSEQGADIIGYLDDEQQSTLEFWLFENKVSLIRFDRTFMK